MGASVTARIREIKQPRGGYLNPKEFEIIQLKNEKELNPIENISPSIVGTVVDYLTRFMTSNNKKTAFQISITGAIYIKEQKKAENLLQQIEGLDDKSISAACKLVGYDVVTRTGPANFVSVDTIQPNEETIFNIREMVERSIQFFKKYGPVVKYGITFMGGYTDIISTGDADFITEETLWDFKVSKNPPDSKQTLQLLIYYLLGIHSIHYDDYFYLTHYLAIYNPRLNTIYRLDIDKIPEETINIVENEIIGY